MNKYFFRFGFIILTSFNILLFIFALTIFTLDNPFMFSWHPDFFIGIFYGLAYFGSFYLGWIKNKGGD